MIRCSDGHDRFERASGELVLAKKIEVTLGRNEIRKFGRTNAHVTRREQHPSVELREPIAATSHLDEELPLMLPAVSTRAVKVHHLVGD